MHQCYPARTEPGWIQAGIGLPEQEIFTILVEILPKQPKESFKAFAARFNKICRQARKEYILQLKKAEWETRLPYSGFEWIDRLAHWQAGRKASQIDPALETNSDRAAFSRGIRTIGAYIGITPRTSKHNPKRLSKH
jgi:hypothetical protein